MIRFENVSKIFGTGVYGLEDITLSVEPGEFVFLVGHTGSGKTTMLKLLIRDMIASKGKVVVGEFDLVKLSSRRIPHLRRKVGVVFQDLKLLWDRTIFENVLLPLQVAGIENRKAYGRVEELLSQVNVLIHRDKFPVQLSGGELQRVAIARALALSPEVLLADEPTGNLDVDTANGIIELLSAINKRGTTIVMATHNMDIVNKLKKRVVTLDSGKVIKDENKEVKEEKNDEDREILNKEIEEQKGIKETFISSETMAIKKAIVDKKVPKDKEEKHEHKKKESSFKKTTEDKEKYAIFKNTEEKGGKK